MCRPYNCNNDDSEGEGCTADDGLKCPTCQAEWNREAAYMKTFYDAGLQEPPKNS